MKIPRLSISENTFSNSIWNGFCLRYGKDRAKKIVSALSKPAKDFAIRTTLTKTSPEDVIEILEKNNWKAKQHKILPEIVTAQTQGMNYVPYLQSAPRIIMDKLASESVFVGSNLFGVGIKRMPKLKVGQLASLLSPKKQIVAIGKANVSSKTERMKGIAVFNTNSFYKVPSTRDLGFLDSGKGYGQSLPAAYVGHLLDPRENDTIIDLCAAPGGKSTSAAILSNDKANIIAFDRSKKRLEKMEISIRNQGLKNIRTLHANSIDYFKTHTIKADKIIVDPSCSATGVRPKLYEETTEIDSINAAKYQKSFLWIASKIVRKGGIITYSTCTLEPRENEKIISYAVHELNLELVEPNILMGTKGEETGDGLIIEFMRRFYPDTFDTPGFFVAKLMKK
ncbi:MAG: RsmB/NOP family class I SAM-dependent RNA methyltransferase [Asgard group archaeon]|nr:RsmB/NOP family class I SAM-dependent RNA methyltransferase [Asgard group archaeon]